MWIDFNCNYSQSYMIKIYCGGVNVVSGEPAEETAATKMRRLKKLAAIKDGQASNRSGSGDDTASPLQDYIVVPAQDWLDGIADSDGTVRQFVAMPFGSGCSVESQVTGADSVGGLQFEITPMRTSVRRQAGAHGSVEGQTGAYPIQVKTLTGKKFPIWVLPDDQIDTLKCRIEAKEGIPPDQQRLVFQGRKMKGLQFTWRYFKL